MNKFSKSLILFVLPLLLVSLACSASDGISNSVSGAVSGALEDAINEGLKQAAAEYGFDLPIDKVTNVSFEDGQLNMQAEGDFQVLLAALRSSAVENGLTEEEIYTSLTDTTASLVFSGHESGQSLVLQMVDLGNGQVNINIRLEDL